MAKLPAKPKPTDPLAHAHVHVREAAPRMPALSSQQTAPPSAGHNSGVDQAEEMLNSAVARLDALDAQIKALNRQKSDVYAELKAQGLDVKILRDTLKDAKLDPLVLEDRDRRKAIYLDVLRRGAAAKAAEQAA